MRTRGRPSCHQVATIASAVAMIASASMRLSQPIMPFEPGAFLGAVFHSGSDCDHGPRPGAPRTNVASTASCTGQHQLDQRINVGCETSTAS
jgi:hypothetical protein